MKRYNLLIILLIITVLTSRESYAFWIWTPKTKKLINPKYVAKDTPEEQFRWAMKFFKEKDYKRSAMEFTNLTNHFKDSDLAPEAQYYAGLSYEKGGKFYLAFQAYQRTIDVYPLTKRIDEIIEKEYNLGSRLYKRHRGKLMGKEIMTDLDRAIEIFQKVRENVPFGEYADKAQFMTGQSYKKGEQFTEAVKAFQVIAEEYPKSDLTGKAKYEVAQCTYLASLKPDYDQELTDEAIAEFKELAKARDSSGISKQAGELVTRLEEKKAESIFNVAKFYERQKHYKSAIIYYSEVLKKYPHTTFGKLASEKVYQLDRLSVGTK